MEVVLGRDDLDGEVKIDGVIKLVFRTLHQLRMEFWGLINEKKLTPVRAHEIEELVRTLAPDLKVTVLDTDGHKQGCDSGLERSHL